MPRDCKLPFIQLRNIESIQKTCDFCAKVMVHVLPLRWTFFFKRFTGFKPRKLLRKPIIISFNFDRNLGHNSSLGAQQDLCCTVTDHREVSVLMTKTTYFILRLGRLWIRWEKGKSFLWMDPSICLHVYMYVYRVYVHVISCFKIHVHWHTYIHPPIHPSIHPYLPTYLLTFKRTYTHTHWCFSRFCSSF